jgi:Zn-dependent protease with chaperone function
MSRSKRFITLVAILIQGYAVAFAVSRPQLWDFMVRQNKLVLYLGLFLLYLLGDRVMHGLMTSEIIRKMQLEADQIAAQQIQKTLQPEKLISWRATRWKHFTSRSVPWVATTLT